MLRDKLREPLRLLQRRQMTATFQRDELRVRNAARKQLAVAIGHDAVLGTVDDERRLSDRADVDAFLDVLTGRGELRRPAFLRRRKFQARGEQFLESLRMLLGPARCE